MVDREPEHGERIGSPLSVEPHGSVELGYVSRRVQNDRIIVHIAGIHSPGSRGVVHYLTRNLIELDQLAGDGSFSLAIRCSFDGVEITESTLLLGPYRW